MTKDNLTERRVDEFLDQHMTLTGSTTQLTVRNIVREMLVRYDAQQQALLEEAETSLAELISLYDMYELSVLQPAYVGACDLLTRLRADHG